ncbi:hypothetical protein U27_03120 [Candidatus Vecturithrix granuli]|uniref:Uncharacterized protein n=1 Tax=Vecturithrix granuli TaxID=1499967 RepID=A0A081BV03_VECG1|nr:hypothetical protein U27_03120 [Candidatus Vecturithrix granuli]
MAPKVSQHLFERMMVHDFVEETMHIPVLAGVYASCIQPPSEIPWMNCA